MTVKSELGKSILTMATDHYMLKEKLEGTEKAPIDEISYLLTSYNTLVRDLANKGITVPNESQKYLIMLTKGLEKRIGELLPKTTAEDAEQLKIALQENKPQAEMPSFEKVKRLNLYDRKEYTRLILEGIAEQIDYPGNLTVVQNRARLAHQDYNHHILISVHGLVETKTQEVLSEATIYLWSKNDSDLILHLYITEDLQFMQASEKTFEAIPMRVIFRKITDIYQK